jgi:hypothetical protein
MIYDLDEILKQKLTKDENCERLYDNLKGIYEAGQEESRHYGEEQQIKLNRLERKEEPMKVRQGDFTYLYCPVCGNRFETWVQLDPYCSKCGQRLQL